MKNEMWSFLFGVIFGIILCSMVMIAIIFSNQGKITGRVIITKPKIVNPQNKLNKEKLKKWKNQKQYYLKSI